MAGSSTGCGLAARALSGEVGTGSPDNALAARPQPVEEPAIDTRLLALRARGRRRSCGRNGRGRNWRGGNRRGTRIA